MQSKKKKNILIKVICGSSVLFIGCILVVLCCVLMLFDFFGAKLTKEKVQNNLEYSDAYLLAINNYLKDGYVPLQRLLYFHLEDTTLALETLYTMNQNKEQKTAREMKTVCEDQRVKNMVACTDTNINENKEYLEVSTGHFNLPLDKDFLVTSYYNEQRTIFNTSDFHSGWDLAVAAETPVYSVCSGVVEDVTFTQDINVSYDVSGNKIGNLITIKCNKDYEETYYVIFAHLYPNSAKVKVGDEVDHWTEIASVGTTGYANGNHLHYQVENSNRETIDGMQLIDFTLENSNTQFELEKPHDKYYDDFVEKQEAQKYYDELHK